MKAKLDATSSNQLKYLINTIVFVCKDISFHKFQILCNLQAKNGLDLGNDKGSQAFVSCIADVEKQPISDDLVNTKFISVIADGAADNGIIENETLVCECKG